MNILLVNDDGYNCQGIHIVKKILAKYGHVVIIAPKECKSACSVCITIGKPVHLEKGKEDEYILDGFPADCVAFGLSNMNQDFDLVVAGCNKGLNLSYDTMYSGTCGAALEALSMGVPSIAISSDDNFENVENCLDTVLNDIFHKNLLNLDYFLNINIPKGNINGFKYSSLYYRKDQNYYVKKDDGYYEYRHLQSDFSDDINSDCYLVEHGYISITPLNKSYFCKDTLTSLLK